MTWREAFLRQAASDHAIRKRLNSADVEYCHRLHYLQMETEKLAKAFLSRPDDDEPPAASHAVFVKFLRVIRGRNDIRRLLGFSDPAMFRRFIDSLLPLAHQIQELAPSAAGVTRPNPEYPWRPTPTSAVVAPAEFEFPLFDPRSPKIAKLDRLLDRLIDLAQ